MALDRANGRIFVPGHGNGGFRIFELDESGLPTTRDAIGVIGRPSLFGRRSVVPPTAREPAFPGSSAVYDNSTDRLFVVDRVNNRILVFDAAPDELRPFPAASIVIGQPNFTSRAFLLTGPNRFGFVSDAVIDEVHQRLFVSDLLHHRVLVFDVHPDRLVNDPPAQLVLGQDHFFTVGVTGADEPRADTMNAPSHVAYDVAFDRLFVGDSGNGRVLVFDAAPGELRNGDNADVVMGQDDFGSAEPREDLDELAPPGGILDSMGYDWVHHRLFIGEGGGTLEHRVMVFDAHPDQIGGRTRATAVIGQPTRDSLLPAVSRTRLTMPRPIVEPTTQKLYVSEGFPGGNRVAIFDIRPEVLRTGMPAVDVIGQETPDGRPDFDARMAQGHLDGRSIAAARAVAHDPVDHRLFVADQYNHRVVVYELDDHDRVARRDAVAVLGQPDPSSSRLTPANETNMGSPLAVAYDATTKRLYAGDGIHNRVLVFDAAPGTLRNGAAATAVIGQPDFETVEYRAGPAGLDFDVRGGRGIASTFIPMGLAIDEPGQRLFVSDGGNNRILVFDVSAAHLVDGMPAATVLGQPDMRSTAEGGGPTGLADPGHLAFDPVHQRLFAIDGRNLRVLVYDVAPDRLTDGAAASAVIGQPDLERTGGSGPGDLAALLPYLQVEPLPPIAAPSARTPPDRFAGPNGVAYDPVHELLYVADAGGLLGGGAHRVAVFDVAPERLEDGPDAIRILGKRDADETPPLRQGGASSYPGQFTLHDPRGLALDADDGVLYVTDSLTSRVVAFYLPRATWPVTIAPDGWVGLSTLDAVDLDYGADPRTTASASLAGEAEAATVHHLASEVIVDATTQRHRRVLTGEAALAASTPDTASAHLLDTRGGWQHEIALRNPGDVDGAATVGFHDEDGVQRAEVTVAVPAHHQAVHVVSDLLAVDDAPGLLVIDATTPLATTVLSRTTNARGEVVLAPVPAATVASGTRSGRVLPFIAAGRQRSTRIALSNPGPDPVAGTVTFHGEDGREWDLLPGGQVPYAVPPWGSTVLHVPPTGTVETTGYAVVTSTRGAVPSVYASVTERRGDVVAGRSVVSATTATPARFAAATRPTLIRHGRVRNTLVVVNAGDVAATVTIRRAGERHDIDRAVPAGAQRSISLDAFLANEAPAGVVTVTSTRPVSLTWRQTTVNARGEPITVELPPLQEGDDASALVVNGGGEATELRLAGSAGAAGSGALRLATPDGSSAGDILLSASETRPAGSPLPPARGDPRDRAPIPSTGSGTAAAIIGLALLACGLAVGAGHRPRPGVGPRRV